MWGSQAMSSRHREQGCLSCRAFPAVSNWAPETMSGKETLPPQVAFFGCSVSVTSEVASRQNTLNIYICKQLTSMRFEIEGLYFICHYSLSSGWKVIWRAPNRDFHLRLHPYTKSSGTTGGGRRESRRTVTRQLCLLAVIGKMCRWNHNIWLHK